MHVRKCVHEFGSASLLPQKGRDAMASAAVRAKIAAVHARIAAMGDLLLKSASAEEIDTNSERQARSLLATLR